MTTKLTIRTPAPGFLSLTPTAETADATGNYVIPSEVTGCRGVVLRFANTGGAPVTVTFDDPNSINRKPLAANQFDPDVPVVVTNAQQRYVIIQDFTRFVDKTTLRLNWTYSGALTGSVEVVGIF